MGREEQKHRHDQSYQGHVPWRGWFYSTDVVDIGVKSVDKYVISDKPSKEIDSILAKYGMTANDLNPTVFMQKKTKYLSQI